MRAAFKWLGFALVAIGVAAFPFAIWYPGPWGVISLVLVMIGCFVLVAVLRARSIEQAEEDRNDGAARLKSDQYDRPLPPHQN